jgi:hypothetical protein
MDDVKHPTEGGSYVREKDGSLTKVEGTKPAPEPTPAPAPEPETHHQEQ